MISVNNQSNNSNNNNHNNNHSDQKNNEVKYRLCHLKKDKNFNGYGFNLHAEKNKHGHYIGNIDPGSPAEKAELKEGDRIIEVNGSNVEMETHKQVVNRIRLIPFETRLLVIDSNQVQFNNANDCPFNGHVYPALNLQISVAEFRAKLAERKKYDPKKEPIAFRKKYEIADKL